MGLPITAGCDTAWNRTRDCSDASCTEMQWCHVHFFCSHDIYPLRVYVCMVSSVMSFSLSFTSTLSLSISLSLSLSLSAEDHRGSDFLHRALQEMGIIFTDQKEFNSWFDKRKEITKIELNGRSHGERCDGLTL